MQTPVIDLVDEVAQMCRSCPTTLQVQAYVHAARRLCNKSRWLAQTVSGSTAANTVLYALGDDPYVEIIGIKALQITETPEDIHPLTEAYSGGWDPNEAPGVPEFYQYVPQAQFALFPTPDKVYALSVSLALQPKRGANSLDSSLIAEWDYAFEAGALAALLAIPGMPWTDKREAAAQAMMFRGYCNQALGAGERGYNAGAALTERNGNPSAGLRTRVLAI